MRLRKWLSALLAAAILAGMFLFPPASAAGNSAFTDIADAGQANAAETLRLLGVVNGTGTGAFNPSGTLTRGEFCKMVVEIMGRGAEEPAQRSRTIFTDVGPRHWARGYINLASSITVGGGGSSGDGESQSAGTRLIMGVGDGTFRPDRPITMGEAVTILMRVLGYQDGDVATGTVWYEGYMGLAAQAGLDKGLTVSGGANLTRGQAAILFYNLLFTSSKGGDEPYLTTRGCSITEPSVLLDVTSAAAGTTNGKVFTAAGTYQSGRVGMDETLGGTLAKLVLDKDKKVLAILPEEGYTYKAFTVMGSPQANAIPTVDGDTVAVTLDTQVYRSDSADAETYEQVWTSLRTGTAMVACYDAAGQLQHLYRTAASTSGEHGRVMVVKNKPAGTGNAFYPITDGKTPTIYKNGIPADTSDIRQYDVGTYDPNSNTLFISDLKLCGLYEDAYPNAQTPSTITMMGAKFQVLPSAMADLATFKVGSRMTLLLTATGEVAGAVSTDVAKSNAVGVAQVTSKDDVSITLLDGLITLKGGTTYSDAAAEKLNGYLVTVSSSSRGILNLSRTYYKGSVAPLDLEQERLGTKKLSPGARFFEQVGNGTLVEIKRSDITVPLVMADQISYVGYDWANRVDKVVLNDVTGDRYQYGEIYYRPAGPQEIKNPDGTVTQEYQNGEIRVRNGSGDVTYTVGRVEDAKSGKMGGIAGSLSKIEDNYLMAGFMAVQSVKGIRRAQFDLDTMTLTTNEMVLPISSQVQCYNKTTGQWYSVSEGNYLENLKLALAFCDDITVYYDRSPDQGGKVRIVEVK